MNPADWRLRLAAGVLCVVVLAGAGESLAALSGIEPGKWRLHEQNGAGDRALCVTDPATLLQLRHGGAACHRRVLESTPTQLTVRYVCPGAGFGRTTITVETPRLLRIQTQGVAEGQPFLFDYEGRRMGDCGGAGHSR